MSSKRPLVAFRLGFYQVMIFRPRNTYYMRISTNVVLPLFLYLDERHIDWMSDVVLQHVLADLRPLIIPKLRAEKDIHFGPGSAPQGNKRGTVDVHRGETYQFAYFFRKTEPHTVLFKSRYFATAPARPVSKSASPQFADQNFPRGRQVFTNRNKRKRVQTDKTSQSHLEEDEWSDKGSEEDMDDVGPIPIEPRLLRKQRRVVTDIHRDDDDDMREDVTMTTLPPEMDGESSENPEVSSPVIDDRDAAVCDARGQPSDTQLDIEEEEAKPKPLLKLKYQSFPISGHCLCVVVEPWPPLHAQPKVSVGQRMQLQRDTSEPLLVLSKGSVTSGERAKTPLFLPEYDEAPREVLFTREKTLPPVPLFHDMLSAPDDNDGDDFMNFSQTLNAAGHMHAIAADDDDDMDGTVLFGDADEVRELF